MARIADTTDTGEHTLMVVASDFLLQPSMHKRMIDEFLPSVGEECTI
jgi:hypothetical protein